MKDMITDLIFRVAGYGENSAYEILGVTKNGDGTVSLKVKPVAAGAGNDDNK